MNILLVNPPRINGIPVIREERCEITDRYSVIPPYSLLQIGSILRKEGHYVELIDANGFNIPYKEVEKKMGISNFDVLIFRFTPTTFDWDMEITRISKKRNRNAITVGLCLTLNSIPQIVLENAPNLDFYILSDYETVIPNLISSINSRNYDAVNGISYRASHDRIEVTRIAEPIGYDSIPLPAYDLLPSLEPYYENARHGTPFTIIYTSKGCPFKCIYCTVANTKWKYRSAESILNEIRYLKNRYNIKLINFFDETFTLKKERVIEICDALIKENLNVSWYCNSRVDLINEKLLKKMKDAGCRGISYGIESGSQSILNETNKNINIKQAESAIKITKKIGIKTYCSFIFGLPGENWSTVNETIGFVKRTLPTGAQFNIAVPYPGTKLYEICVNKGWIDHISFRNLYQHTSIMNIDQLTSLELEVARKKAYHSLYSNPRWWLQNINHVIKNPEDIKLAINYTLKIMNNFLINKMEHAH